MRVHLFAAVAAIATILPAAAPAQDAAATTVEAEVISLPEWHPDVLYTGGWSAEEFIDEMEVYGPTGEQIGDVENLVISADGKVLSAIVEIGGFLEMGDTHVNVPWERIEFNAARDGIIIPVTQETIEEFSLFPDEVITAPEAAADIEAVEGDNPGTVETGPRAWLATELIGDYARLREGEGFVNYGYVDDLIIKDGQVAAVVANPDVAWGARGLYVYSYYGYPYGWTPGLATYDLPYARADIAELEPLDYERFDD